MAKSPDDAMVTMIQNLKDKTGKSLDEWAKLARATGLTKHGEIVKHLKAEHGLGHGYANLIAQTALQGDEPAPAGDDLVEAQYAGPKASLRPLYEAMLAAIRKFGPDVEVSPKKTYVSLRRNKQFALIQPTTATRLDVGINLKGKVPTGRLEASGSFNAMVSHRIRVGVLKDVDAELLGWLKEAYQAS